MTEMQKKILQLLKVSDSEMIELGIVLFLNEPHEWRKEVIPWNSMTHYRSNNLWNEASIYTKHPMYTAYENLSAETKWHTPRIWIRDNYGVVYMAGCLCYRSLVLLTCLHDFDNIEKIYL